MQRRQVLAAGLGLGLLGGSTRLLAAGQGSARLLFVFLRGGYDAASLLVPTASDFYYEARPDIALARPSADAASAIALNADWGLHPALRDSLYPLYLRGELAFIPFAGTDDLSRSHFETQDSIELGQGAQGRRNYNSGFLNRLAAVVGDARPMAFTDQLPKIFKGSVAVANTALKSLPKPGVDARQSDIIAAMYQGTALTAPVQQGFASRKEVMHELVAEMNAADRSAISAKGFELEAMRIGKLMKDTANLCFVDVGGWDSHVNQGAATGYLANRLDELGRGLAVLPQVLGSAWKDTTVVIMSEFGRTFRQNGNRGTDHGHGSVMWVMGGSVRGGRVVGEQMKVQRSTLLQDRDFPVLNDYRGVLGDLFRRQFGLTQAQMALVFSGAPSASLGLL